MLGQSARIAAAESLSSDSAGDGGHLSHFISVCGRLSRYVLNTQGLFFQTLLKPAMGVALPPLLIFS